MDLDCRVSLHGENGIEHVVTLKAGSVYHAAGIAMQKFRTMPWTAELLARAPFLIISVEGRSYRVAPKRVELWLQSSSRSPAEHSRKQALRSGRSGHTRR